ncbi:Stf0 family sulfotransferase [Alteromonas sp. ASW11-19]|uniref:Stf0 family sulfotransferase n=1 Tax=Alteromonas salexigens TaxID=2982530 RepID=A0ABT2VW90_9ALTE|nr:Stf0 family sulfotransferase [Alteromonas salexigens]MCU7556109.1 Stf0 family sulfotransferase [Alteromonas salexigens]
MSFTLYEDQFDSRHDYTHDTPADKTLVIASTVRSGSHMLGHALHATGAFGFPLEYAHPKNLAEWQKRFGVTNSEAAFEQLLKTRTSENGVFGIKIHYRHLNTLGGLKGLLSRFPDPHFVLLTRDDLVAQAVSLSIARQTGNWISGQADNNKPVTYSYNDIADSMRRVILDNASWQYLLAANGVKSLAMQFSEVQSNTRHAITRIADFMNVEIDPQTVPTTPVTQAQKNSVNQTWIERFIEESQPDEELLEYHREQLTRRLLRKLT